MTKRNYRQILAISVTSTIFCLGAFAQTEVHKWVDEDGVVHFGDTPPDESTLTETLVIPEAPPAPAAPAAPAPNQSSINSPAASTSSGGPAPNDIKAPVLYEKTDISKLSIADLDARCDEAREAKIAPLREAEIANCKQDKREDPIFCERFNADFGDGGRTFNGSIRPRMFDDLPECVQALQETNRRQR
jgi:hypothetical protein